MKWLKWDAIFSAYILYINTDFSLNVGSTSNFFATMFINEIGQ